MENYSDSFYPTVSNIDGRAEFEKLLYGDVGLPGIGRKAVLRRMNLVFFGARCSPRMKNAVVIGGPKAVPACIGAALGGLAWVVGVGPPGRPSEGVFGLQDGMSGCRGLATAAAAGRGMERVKTKPCHEIEDMGRG